MELADDIAMTNQLHRRRSARQRQALPCITSKEQKHDLCKRGEADMDAMIIVPLHLAMAPTVWQTLFQTQDCLCMRACAMGCTQGKLQSEHKHRTRAEKLSPIEQAHGGVEGAGCHQLRREAALLHPAMLWRCAHGGGRKHRCGCGCLGRVCR